MNDNKKDTLKQGHNWMFNIVCLFFDLLGCFLVVQGPVRLTRLFHGRHISKLSFVLQLLSYYSLQHVPTAFAC